MGRDERSAGYNFGVEDVILENLPAAAGDFEAAKEHQLVPVLPEPIPPHPAGTPVYRGRTLAECLAKLRQAPAAERADAVRAIGSFGEDAAAAANTVAGLWLTLIHKRGRRRPGRFHRSGRRVPRRPRCWPKCFLIRSPCAFARCSSIGGDGAGGGSGIAGIGSRS